MSLVLIDLIPQVLSVLRPLPACWPGFLPSRIHTHRLESITSAGSQFSTLIGKEQHGITGIFPQTGEVHLSLNACDSYLVVYFALFCFVLRQDLTV